jgi:SHS2 domain-containing protein
LNASLSRRRTIQSHWEHFPHDADVGIRGIGASKAEAFEQAAIGLTAVITDPRMVAPREQVRVSCDAPDDEMLLVDWLNALVYEMATRKLIFSRFEVQLAGQRLEGTAWGETVDQSKHHPAVEVKGATYTALRVRHDPNGAWIAQCVLDV